MLTVMLATISSIGNISTSLGKDRIGMIKITMMNKMGQLLPMEDISLIKIHNMRILMKMEPQELLKVNQLII